MPALENALSHQRLDRPAHRAEGDVVFLGESQFRRKRLGEIPAAFGNPCRQVVAQRLIARKTFVDVRIRRVRKGLVSQSGSLRGCPA